jgi:hypothetical protein
MIDLIAAIIATIIFAGMVVFQLLLVLGLPLGHLAWGGQQKELPTKLRIASGVSVGIFIFAMVMVLEEAGILNLFINTWVSYISVWVLAIYFTLGILMNGISRSKREKLIMTPIAAISAICCYLIVLL